MPQNSPQPYEPVLSAEVRAALSAGPPVVALESTIIAHGLPRPRNLTVARELEGSSGPPAASRPPSPFSTAGPM